MDFEDTPQEAAYRQEARQWLEQHATLKSGESQLFQGLTDAFSEEEVRHVKESQSWQATLYDHGWAGITWPTEYGGRGGTALQQRIFNQEAAKYEVPTGVFAQGIGMAGPTLLAHGTPEQKERFLRPMLRGDELWCQLFSEPGAGSDLAGLSTRAIRDGEEYIVNGQKVWTSSAHYSDWGILLARTDVDVPKHRGISYFLVDMRSPGIEIRPLRQITGAAHFNEVFLTDVRIPAANLVGGVNNGWAVTMTTVANERNLIGGQAGDLWAPLLRYAQRFDRADDPVIRQDLARAFTRLQLSKYLGWRTQSALSQGKEPGPESSIGKLVQSGNVTFLGDLVMAIGGVANTLLQRDDEEVYAWGMHFLGQWGSKIGGGTDEVQRNILGERVLGLPGDIRADKNVAFKDLPR